jgi:N-acetylmuramic acid 6-phosphate etherase
LKTGKPKTAHDARRLRTEQPNDGAANLDQKSAIEIARLINAEDATVAAAVGRALPQIARAIDLVAAALRRGGRLIYVGAGTSGRIGALDMPNVRPPSTWPRAPCSSSSLEVRKLLAPAPNPAKMT